MTTRTPSASKTLYARAFAMASPMRAGEFTWTVEEFSNKLDKLYSPVFQIGGFNW